MKFVNKDESGCWLWTGALQNSGYGMFGSWFLPGRQKHILSHRASYMLFRGPIPDGLFVCHTCDVKHCANPDHLFLGTNSENIRDHLAKGKSVGGPSLGERNCKAKLQPAQVLQIRSLRDEGESLQDIANRYNVTKQTIWAIVERKNWTHI